MSEYQMVNYKLASENIQKLDPETYKSIFIQCPVVCSAPMSFFWAGEYSSFAGGLAVTLKIPTRVYVGLEPTSENEVRLESFYEYPPPLKKFQEYEYGLQIEKRIIENVKNFIFNKRGKSGFAIHILMENEPWCGLNTSGAIGAALASSLFLSLKLIDGKELAALTASKISELGKNPTFNELFKLAWKIESALNIGFTGGAGAFSALINSTYPLAFHHISKSNPLDYIKNMILRKYNYLDDMTWWAYKMEENEDFSTQASWPIDFALIYTSLESEPESTVKAVLENKNVSLDLKHYQKKINYQNHKLKKTWEETVNDRNILSLSILKNLEEMFRKGFSGKFSNELFLNINNYHHSLCIENVNTPEADEIIGKISQVARENDVPFAFKIIGSGLGGDLLLVVPKFQLARYEMLVRALEELTKIRPLIDYLSWRDGFEEKGVVVEQNVEEGKYSNFTSHASILLKILDNNGFLQSEIMTLEDFEKTKQNFDLLIDVPNEDLYIRGEQLTSKSIPSASYTVELLKTLIPKLNTGVKNTELPRSSYSADRGEMQSKIISPLQKIFTSKIKKKLPIRLSGYIDNFTIKLSPSDIKIALIEKIL